MFAGEGDEDGDKRVLVATATEAKGDGAKVKVKGGGALLLLITLLFEGLLLMVVSWSVRGAAVLVVMVVVLPPVKEDLAVDVDLMLINESCWCFCCCCSVVAVSARVDDRVVDIGVSTTIDTLGLIVLVVVFGVLLLVETLIDGQPVLLLTDCFSVLLLLLLPPLPLSLFEVDFARERFSVAELGNLVKPGRLVVVSRVEIWVVYRLLADDENVGFKEDDFNWVGLNEVNCVEIKLDD